MRRVGAPRRHTLTVALVCVAGLAGAVTLLTVSRPAAPKRDEPVLESREPAARRMPVAGAPGFYVVVEPDGSSYLEKPSGEKQLLVDSDKKSPDTAAVEKRVRERVGGDPGSRPKAEPGQLLVLDKGVVDVPKGAVVTFVGADKAVILNDDGATSTVYHADGRVERRDRKKPLPRPAAVFKKE